MTTRALCAGINHYRNYPNVSLQGCANDAQDMGGVFANFLGFQASEITILTDADATKDNITGILRAMVENARVGRAEYLVFSFSGFGTQVPDKGQDEPELANDAFCPYDLAAREGAWDPQHLILDEELRDVFAGLPQNVLLEIFLDTCHSGAGLKGSDLLLDRRPRYLPPPSIDAFLELEGRRSRGLSDVMLESGRFHRILWWSCRSDQTSADAQIDGAWHGAFTHFLCRILRGCENRLARRALLKKVWAELQAHHFGQIPQIQCDAVASADCLGPKVRAAAA